jgi:hypothetical protein
MNKLQKKLTSGNEAIVNERANIIIDDIQSEIETVITNLEKKKRDVVKRKLNHADIGPDNSTSLRVVDENFDASDWVKTLMSLEKELVMIEIELNIAGKLKKEWLDEE